MRLLQRNDDGSLALTKFYTNEREVPSYAVLSHRWLSEDEEVIFTDMLDGTAESKPNGYEKIRFCAQKAAEDGLRFFWIDTCCIDKRNNAEVQETITRMFRWYQNANHCYVFMTDVLVAQNYGSSGGSDATWEPAFRNSRWFTRGWTLQELLAPRFVTFYSKEGIKLGSKHSLRRWIHEITGIPTEGLEGRALSTFTVAERMSWANGRETSREEDKAYCLLGIFGTFMLPMYGEGEHAFIRLREEVEKRHPATGQASQLLDSLPIASSAAFNSRENEHEDLCLPTTRAELLEKIDKWIDGSSSKCVFWLNGIAGTGKSTIARTVATKYHGQGRLGGSFFFSKGGGDANHAGKLVTTLAFQLARTIPSARQYICEAIMEHKAVVQGALREQWSELILKPLSKLHSDYQSSAVVMIVDALDECASEKDINVILDLFRSANTLKNNWLRILVTSRPEVTVRYGFQQNIPKADRHDFVLQDVAPTLIDRDLTLFFEHQFDVIRSAHGIPTSWPSEQDISRLVQRSSGLFIWAATACRYILSGRRFAKERMSKLIHGLRTPGGPERQLDQIYITILKDSLQQDYEEEELSDFRAMLKDVLGNIVTLFWPLSVDSLAVLLNVESSTIAETLADLHAIINIPEGHDHPVRLHHPSFRDFLLDQNRCSDLDFWIDQQEAHKLLAKKCISLMARHLRQDLCDLGDPGATAVDLSRDRLPHLAPSKLRYACLYWADHCRQGNLLLQDDDFVHRFLKDHFLNWLEAISLGGRSSDMAPILRMYQSILAPPSNPRQIPFIKDARRFTNAFHSIIEERPLQVYCAALVYIHSSNGLRHHFWSQLHPRIRSCRIVEGGGPDYKDEYNYVNDLSFTPDSSRVASGSLDEWVRIWDVASMSIVGRLGGTQADKISSVNISSDGSLLASGSDDSTVVILDLVSKSPLHTLTGHSRWVNSVAFAPRENLLVTGSMDESVRLWDTTTGREIAVLENISTGVNDLSFSPSGSSIAVGTVDQAVRLWDFRKREVYSTLDGHTGAVNTVCFSPDGKRLLSGSDDTVIKVWDLTTSKEIMTLGGHSKTVWAVTYSLDARVIASGSADTTVKLWDASSGDLLHTLKGHISGINAVQYSPNGHIIASASFNDEVRLWDAHDGSSLGKLPDFVDHPVSVSADEDMDVDTVSEQDFKGHSETVTCIKSSADGRLVASGSVDTIVKMWNVDGTQSAVLEGHTGAINSIAFSPSGHNLASASQDCTAKLWDTVSGQILYTFPCDSVPVRLVCLNGDGSKLATCSADSTVIVWSAIEGIAIARLEGHLGTVMDVTFSPDGAHLASCAEDMTACHWDLSSPTQPLIRLFGHTDSVNSVNYSPDGTLIASCSSDKSIRIWDLKGALQSVLEGHELSPNHAAISSDGDRVVSCSADMTIRVWSLSTSRVLGIIPVDVVFRSISFSLCGRKIETDRGAISIDQSSASTSSSHLHASPIFISEQWIKHNAESILWLPEAYRAVATATCGTTAVLGHASGAISFITL